MATMRAAAQLMATGARAGLEVWRYGESDAAIFIR